MTTAPEHQSEKNSTELGFADLVSTLKATVRSPDDAVAGAQRFQELTLRLYLHSDIAVTWHETQEKDGSLEDSTLKFFGDTCLLLLERYEETHPFLIKGLCQLCVVGGKIGRMAMAIVSDCCRGQKRQESLITVLEVVSPLLEVVDSFTPKLQFNLMSSLTLLPHSREFAGVLQPIIHNIIGDIFRDPWNSEYLGLLKTVCLDEDNVNDVMHYGVAAHLISEIIRYDLERGSLYADYDDVPRICDLIDIIGFTIRGVAPAAISQFGSEVLLPNLKCLIGDREGTSRLTTAQSRVCSMIIRLCIAILHTGKAAFDELCFGYHLFDLLIVPVKEPVADASVLTAALYGLSTIMENPESGETFATTFTEEVDIALLLAYLKPERLESLSEISHGNANDLVCSIANFIAHLLALSKKHSRIYELVDIMYEKGLAIMVLEALASGVVDSKVNGAFVRVLSRFSIDRIDSMAIRMMLELMTPSNVIDFEPEVFEYMVSALEQKLDVYSMEPIIEKVCWLLVVTLKTVDARRYEGLQLRCVSLLQTASRTRTGRLLLREDQNSLAIRKALKYEQDFCAYDHADIRVELSCVGQDVNFLNACLFDTFRLKHDHRQIFRVLRVLGQSLRDTQQGAVPEEQLNTIDAMCASEVEDFVDGPIVQPPACGSTEGPVAETYGVPMDNTGTKPIGSSAPYMDGDSLRNHHPPPTEASTYVHRDQQRHLFISLDMAKTILSYLSGSFSPTFTELYQNEGKCNQHSEYWAGLLKGRKIDCEQFKMVDKFDWSINCSGVFDGDRISEDAQLGGTVSNAVAKPCRQLLAYVIGQKLGDDLVMHHTDDPFFSVLSSQLLHKVWLNEFNKVLNPCFVVSAYLRILYGLMAPSVSDVVRDVIKGHFRQPDFVRNLTKLTACSSFLDANITAKLFRTCVRALTIDASVQAESMDIIVVYDILSRFAKGVCEPLRGIVTTVSVNWVDKSMKHVQLVILNVFRALALFAKQTPWIKFSSILEIQEHFVETCITRFIPESVLGLGLQILFQIVSLETSSNVGTYVSHLYQSELLEQLRECCVDLAVAVSSAARNTHYTYVLNSISEQRNSQSLLLRPSLVADLLRRINLAELRKRFQDVLSQKRLERILLIDDAWVARKDGTVREKLIAVTSRAIHLLKVKGGDTFKTTSTFDARSPVWSIGCGLLYVIFSSAPAVEREWTMFILRHTPTPAFVRFVTADAHDLLRECVAKTLDGSMTYLGICQHEGSLCLVALTKDKMATFALKPSLLVERMLKGEGSNGEYDFDEGRDNGVDRHGGEVDESNNSNNGAVDMTSEQGERREPCELLRQCYCDAIIRVTYDRELAVSLSVMVNAEEEDTWNLTFVSDSRREAFKKALALAVGHLAWYRRWE